MTDFEQAAGASSEPQTAMGRRIDKALEAKNYGTAAIGIEHRHRCRFCWDVRGIVTPHPRSMQPPLDQDHCPVCGVDSAPVDTQIVEAKLTGVWGWLAAKAFAIAQALNRWSERNGSP